MNIQPIIDRCWEKHITIAALERTVGLGNGTIAKWKEGSPRVDNLKRVADCLECTLDDLIADDPQSVPVGDKPIIARKKSDKQD